MILIGFLCVLAALALLVAGLTSPDITLVWISIGISLVGGLFVLVAAVRRTRALRAMTASAGTSERARKSGAAEKLTANRAAKSGQTVNATKSDKPAKAADKVSPVQGQPTKVGAATTKPDEADEAEDPYEADDLDAVDDFDPDENDVDNADELNDADEPDDAAEDPDVAEDPDGADEPDVDQVEHNVDDIDGAGEPDADETEDGDTDEPAGTDDADDVPAAEKAAASAAGSSTQAPDEDPPDEPGEEDVDVADLLIVIDLDDPVLVVDLRPRYHRTGCAHLVSRDAIALPVREAREDGFTPCVLCSPDSALAEAVRSRRTST